MLVDHAAVATRRRRLASVMLSRDVVDQDQAERLAVLGDVGDAVRRSPWRRVETSTSLAVQHAPSPVMLLAVGAAEDAHGELGAARRPSARRCRRPRPRAR